jgi:hypothetical protein
VEVGEWVGEEVGVAVLLIERKRGRSINCMVEEVVSGGRRVAGLEILWFCSFD